MRRHTCGQCGIEYDSTFKLKNHIRKKHDKPQKLGTENVCCICGKEFEDKTWLSHHMDAVHDEEYTKLNDGRCYIKQYRQVKREIPGKYEDVFDELTGSGRGLLSVQAAICYIESPVTQEIAAESFAVSEVTLRRVVEEIVDRGIVSLEYIRDNNVKDGDGQFGKYTAGERKWEPKA